MLQLGMKLIGEFVARTAAARSFGTAALNHEIRYDAMKDKAVVERLAGLGSVGERDKILHGLRHAVGEKPRFEAALGGIENGVNFLRHEGDCSSLGKRMFGARMQPDRASCTHLCVLHLTM